LSYMTVGAGDGIEPSQRAYETLLAT